MRDILEDFENIIKANVQELPLIIKKYTTGNYKQFSKDKVFRNKIETLFDYNSFRSSAKASWFAEKFDIKACLYCNSQFALVVGKENNKLLRGRAPKY